VDGVGHPLDDPGTEVEDPDTGGEGPLHDGGDTVVDPTLGCDVDRLDHCSGV
jgi:hypothetical protein